MMTHLTPCPLSEREGENASPRCGGVAEGHSVLDPRTKLCATICLITGTFLADQIATFIGIAALFVGVFVMSRTPPRMFGRNILLLSWLLGYTFVIRVWADLSAGRDALFFQGVLNALLPVGQLVVAVGWVTILSRSTSSFELMAGTEWLLSPLRFGHVSFRNFTMAAMLSVRFLPIIFEEGRHLLHAHIARGIDISEQGIVPRLKEYAMLCGMLFSSLLRRVHSIVWAMESRAFRAGAERTWLHERHITIGDYSVLGGSVTLVGLYAILHFLFNF